jgi:hypothetical protein
MALVHEGFSIVVNIDGVVTPLFKEVEVTPPGWNLGGAINIAGQRNTRYVTKAPQGLIEIDQAQFTCGIDPGAIAQLEAIAGVNKVMTFVWPDGYEIDICGWVEAARPTGGMSRGNRPLWNVIIEVSNIDPTTGNEQGPVERAAP